MTRNIECSICRNTFKIELTTQQEVRWKGGEHIQNVAPELSDGERELLISGICGECYDALFEDEEE